MRKNNTAIILGGLFFSCSVMAGVGTLAPTVVPMVNGGQASIAISNTSPNLFTVHWCLVPTAKSHRCQPEPLTVQLSGP